MARPVLSDDRVTPRALARIEAFQPDFLSRVQEAIASHDVVVVGMAWNPHVPKARRLLDQAGIPHHDLDHGNYLTGWKARLAVKMWSGWATFPQVFVKGTLVGGAVATQKSLEDGSLRALLEG